MNNAPNAQECDAIEAEKGYNAWLIEFLIADTEYRIKAILRFHLARQRDPAHLSN